MTCLPGRARAGFTLIELLVVIVVVGVLAGVVVVGFVGADKERELQTEARRLALLIELARDEALQRNEEWGVYIDEDGYGFAVYEENRQRWTEQERGRFRGRTVQQMRLAVTVDELVPPGQEDVESFPQIIIFSSGEQTPFTIEVTPTWDAPAWRVHSDGVSRTALERDV